MLGDDATDGTAGDPSAFEGARVGNVQLGAAAAGAQAAAPTAMRPPPVTAAARRKPRRVSGENVAGGGGWVLVSAAARDRTGGRPFVSMDGWSMTGSLAPMCRVAPSRRATC